MPQTHPESNEHRVAWMATNVVGPVAVFCGLCIGVGLMVGEWLVRAKADHFATQGTDNGVRATEIPLERSTLLSSVNSRQVSLVPVINKRHQPLRQLHKELCILHREPACTHEHEKKR